MPFIIYKYCTVLAVLVRITDHVTQYFTLFVADYTVGTTIALLQTVLSLTVLSIHPFRRLLTVDYSPPALGSRCLFSRQLLSRLSLADSPD
jgi:hypothetical protein